MAAGHPIRLAILVLASLYRRLNKIVHSSPTISARVHAFSYNLHLQDRLHLQECLHLQDHAWTIFIFKIFFIFKFVFIFKSVALVELQYKRQWMRILAWTIFIFKIVASVKLQCKMPMNAHPCIDNLHYLQDHLDRCIGRPLGLGDKLNSGKIFVYKVIASVELQCKMLMNAHLCMDKCQ